MKTKIKRKKTTLYSYADLTNVETLEVFGFVIMFEQEGKLMKCLDPKIGPMIYSNEERAAEIVKALNAKETIDLREGLVKWNES